jgi:hypothetical protein
MKVPILFALAIRNVVYIFLMQYHGIETARFPVSMPITLPVLPLSTRKRVIDHLLCEEGIMFRALAI